jgi:hypothetical protein
MSMGFPRGAASVFRLVIAHHGAKRKGARRATARPGGPVTPGGRNSPERPLDSAHHGAETDSCRSGNTAPVCGPGQTRQGRRDSMDHRTGETAQQDPRGSGSAEALRMAEMRLTAALDRLALIHDRLAMADPAPASGETAALEEALEAERAANEQLEERVRAIKERQEKVVSRLEAEVAGLRAALAERDAAFEGLRAANDRLRANNTALREAILAGVAEPDMVNRAMAHELDGLRAARAADRAEVELILAELRPLVEEAPHA